MPDFYLKNQYQFEKEKLKNEKKTFFLEVMEQRRGREGTKMSKLWSRERVYK